MAKWATLFLSIVAAAGCGDGSHDGGGDVTDMGALDFAPSGGPDLAAGGGDGGGPSLVDCSVAANRANDPRCGGILDATVGQGVALAHQNLFGAPLSGGGFLDGGRLVLAVDIDYGSPNTFGIVLAVDLSTGDRTVISGKYRDPANGDHTVGTGTPALVGVHDVQQAPDGSYWASVSTDHALGSAPRFLVKIDPATGNRTQLWSDGGNGIKCTNPTTNAMTTTKYTVDSSSIAIAPDGAVYYSVQGNPQSAGNAIVKLNPKAGTCTLVTASQAAAAGDNRGSGPLNFVGVKGLRLDGSGFIWGVEGDTNSLWKIELASGNRTRVSSHSGSSMVGNGNNDVGQYGLALGLQASDKIWTVGNTTGDEQGAGALTAVDVSNGNRSGPTVADIVGPATGKATAVWHYPGSGLLILSGPTFGVVLFDPQTNNSNYLSKS
jgi:hypothetical protein